MSVFPRLGVNIDHVATLRQARGEEYPSVVEAAKKVLEAGADQITIHLREDRRHIQDIDVEAIHLVTRNFGRPLNLEMGTDPEILDVALAVTPEWICLVPENRQERTTEGGLDLKNESNRHKVGQTIARLKEKNPQTLVSLFVEADLETLQRCAELKADAVEIHTGDYARAFLQGEETEPHFKSYQMAAEFCQEKKMGCHAGHGLTEESVLPLLEWGGFAEYNIGHWIVGQSVFEGIGPVVSRLKALFERYEVKA
jgi:pyridoxine 5-phosphate synthase